MKKGNIQCTLPPTGSDKEKNFVFPFKGMLQMAKILWKSYKQPYSRVIVFFDKKLIIVIIIAAMFTSCATSNYQSSPCWKGKEPRYQNKTFRS